MLVCLFFLDISFSHIKKCLTIHQLGIIKKKKTAKKTCERYKNVFEQEKEKNSDRIVEEVKPP